ncbi:hypothetical protein SJS41_12980 [Klebsiella quasipneumoniae]|uniref:hypothetical protein n=1 Tax=Klebsiella quasipneumoniae TaxID=1463165 RepID=UPI0029DC8042|nr:hypothetical protein [Klebsiella quasipneumoniae]MDX7606270.1 hypothetical protein [Klebsiella quasipneumoniae]
MLNVKENKCIKVKGMVLTGTPERPVYSGGAVTNYNPETCGMEVKEKYHEPSWSNISKPVFDAGK